ncbi:MAG: Ig-like domain-containing protein [Syntrophales bacterium]|nr:Ig-like domain-containing protein [Syntrophales bacterium]
MQNAERNRKNGSHANRLSKSRPCGLLRLLLPFLFLLTMLAPLESNAADLAVINGDFSIDDPSDPNFGWTLSGAAYIDAGTLKLPEGGDTYSEASQVINIPAGTSTLSFTLMKINLEPDQGNPPDAFVVYLEDPTTKSALIEPIDSTAIFRYQQTGEVSYSPKVTVPGASASGSAWTPVLPAQVLVDVSGITTTAVSARVVFSLVNYAGGASQVEIDNFQTMAAPVANDDTSTVNEDTLTPIDIDVLSNDTDLNGNETLDPATVAVATSPAHGSAAVQSDGKIRYAPALNYWGSDSFTYTVKDNDGHLSNTATVTVNVLPVNDAPVANADTLTAAEDTAATYTSALLVGNDTDVEDDTLTVAGVTSGAGGTAALNADGTVTFTPSLNFNGAASFTYTASDGSATSNAATVTVNVAAVNDAPVANADTLTATEDTAATYTAVQLAGNDTDAEGSALTVAGVTSGTGGTAALNADGTVTFTPSLNFNGAASFTYAVSDGSATSSAATVTVNVSPVNDAPVANADVLTATEDTASTYTAVQLAGNDTDVEDSALTVAGVTNGTGGTAALNADGTVTFTPSLNFNGAASFTYTVSDGSATSNAATATVNVAAVNDAPVANAGPDQSIREGNVATLDGSSSADVEDVNLVYSWTQISGAPTVTLSDPAAVKPTFAAPKVQAAGGLLTFQLKVTDSGNAESTDTVSIQINNYVIPCDVNDSGAVDLADSVILLRAFTRLPNPGVSMTLAADVNGDKRLDISEVICTLQHAAGLR